MEAASLIGTLVPATHPLCTCALTHPQLSAPHRYAYFMCAAGHCVATQLVHLFPSQPRRPQTCLVAAILTCSKAFPLLPHIRHSRCTNCPASHFTANATPTTLMTSTPPLLPNNPRRRSRAVSCVTLSMLHSERSVPKTPAPAGPTYIAPPTPPCIAQYNTPGHAAH